MNNQDNHISQKLKFINGFLKTEEEIRISDLESISDDLNISLKDVVDITDDVIIYIDRPTREFVLVAIKQAILIHKQTNFIRIICEDISRRNHIGHISMTHVPLGTFPSDWVVLPNGQSSLDSIIEAHEDVGYYVAWDLDKDGRLIFDENHVAKTKIIHCPIKLEYRGDNPLYSKYKKS